MTSVKPSIIITTQSKKQYDADANSATESDGSQEITIKSFVKTRRGVPSSRGDRDGDYLDTESVGDIFQTNSVKSELSAKKSLEKKVVRLKKAPGGELLFRLGPELIYENVEVTPIPLWPHKSPVESYSTVLQKKSYEIIPISPRKDDGESLQGIEKLFSIKSIVPKAPGGISWDLELMMADIEDYDGHGQPVNKKSSILETTDSAFLKSSLISRHKEEVYVTIPYRTPQRDGSYTYKDHIRVALAETPTEFHVVILSSLVPKGDVQEKQIIKRNERYKVVCKLHRESDIYADGETQTFGEREREVATQCRAPGNKDKVVQVEAHEIYDAFQELGASETRKKIRQEEEALIKASIKESRKDSSIRNRRNSKKKSINGESSSQSDSDTQIHQDHNKMGSKIDWQKYDADESDDDKEPREDVSDDEIKCSSDEEEFEIGTDLDVVLEEKSRKLKNFGSKQKNLPDIRLAVMAMERMISMNIHQEKQADMRGFDILPNELRDSKLKPHYFNLVPSSQYRQKESMVFGPSLKRFWQFKTSFTKGKEVTNLIAHPKNGNIFAACYGSSSFDNENIDGLVCIWNAKNIQYPERIYEFPGTSVTSAAFSSLTPYLLAIGLFDGNLLVYDIRKESPVAVSSTIGSDDKHLGPVWEVYWMKENELAHKGRGKLQEVLISLGNDGVVNRWTAKKGFEPFSILNIRRSHLRVPGRREKRAEALISQHSPAYSICFFPKDYTNYLIGTEEGFIHKCTTAYSEQYINTYIGHTGPVYRIQFSPYDRTIFVSCSGDWTMKIWNLEFTTPLLSMSTGLRTVYDVTCCPSISTVFICASEDHIEVWDISINTLEPIITFKPNTSLRKSIFSTQLKSLVIGDVDGGIQFYGLRNFPNQPKSFREKFNQLHEALGEKKYEKKLQENVDSTYLGQGDSIHIRGQASSIIQEQRSKTLFSGPSQGKISSASAAASLISLESKTSNN